MHFGICVPAFADFSDPRMLAELARDAETAGWEGFFIWDHIFFDPTFYPMADPWVSLAAVALSTQHMRIGTMITPLARRRPWKLAREAVSVDLLSNGRLILGVGLGDPAQWDFARFGLIFLHDGYWNGVQILPEDWVHESTAPLRPDTRTWETMSDWPDYNGYYKRHQTRPRLPR